MQDSELFELINFHPTQASWRQEMFRRDLGGTYGNEPTEHWRRWAKDFLLEPPKDRDGVNVLLRLLTLAESLYPGGMERTRLEESLGYLFNLRREFYHGGVHLLVCITAALQEKVIREDTVDIWGPGMRSGTGLRTYYRRTLLGKSKVDISGMPPMDTEPATPYVPKAERLPVSPTPQRVGIDSQSARSVSPWWRQLQNPPATPQAINNPPTPASLPDDFVWTKAYVDQQVVHFFKQHSNAYKEMALNVLNAKVDMNTFAAEFGPAKICRWINEKHHVQPDHPNPCKPQNINTSATYAACIKSFKQNPNQHPLAKLAYEAESPGVEAILRIVARSRFPGMSKKPIQLVPWSTFIGGMLKTLFEAVFCSSAWLRASVVKVETKKGRMVQIDSDRYPPGGAKGTGMVYCPTCRRWAPRSWGTDLLRQVNGSMPGCMDCLVESESESFEQHLSDLEDKTFAEELKRLSWRPASVRYLIIQSQREYAEASQDYDPDTGQIEYQCRVIRPPYWELFDAHCDWVGKDTHSSEQRYNLLWEIEGKTDGSKFSRRSVGCHCVLLNEDEASLLAEISDYQSRQKLPPSVKRNNINQLFE